MTPAAKRRQQAIEDGVLIDVTSLAKSRGFAWPASITAAAFLAVGESASKDGSEVELGMLLSTLIVMILVKGEQTDRFYFGYRETKYWASLEPGDAGTPVMTIMLEGEDSPLYGPVN